MTGVNRNQRNIRENRRNLQESIGGTMRDAERVRHADDRRARKFDFEVEKRRANNEYLIHERLGRKARSDRSSRLNTESKAPTRQTRRKSIRTEVTINEQHVNVKSRDRPSPKMEDFQVDIDAFTQIRKFWPPDFDDGNPSKSQLIHPDYFGDYEVEDKPKKRSSSSEVYLSLHDLLRLKRNIDYYYEGIDDIDTVHDRREKREEEEPRCSSEVTTLNVGCSTADRMEFQSDCVDDTESVTGKL